jgi:hypothetical protein
MKELVSTKISGSRKGSGAKRGWIALAWALLLATASSAVASPIVVRIDDVPNGNPVIVVTGAPNGYDVYTGSGVATPGVEDGGLITLIGVNNPVEDSSIFPDAYLFDWSGRFVVPQAPDPNRNAVDIVWLEHNWDDPDSPLFGDLRIGFNSALPGVFYANPELKDEQDLGGVTDRWVQVYTSDIVVVFFKPHTYRLRQ